MLRLVTPLLRRWLPALALAALAAGCATTTVAPDPLKSPPRADQSAVVVTVTTNTAAVNAFATVTVRRLQAAADAPQDNHVLNNVAPGMARDTSLFIGVLPAGEYEVLSFQDPSTRKFLNLNEATRRGLGRFTVEAGKAVDLGRLLVTPLNSRVLVGRSSRAASNVALVQRFSNEHGRLFANGVSAGWNSPRTDDDRVEEYALSVPVGADRPTELADGRIVAASRLGTVLMRTKEGRWNALRGPGLESLLYTTPVDLPDAQLLAVGEFGTLLRLPPGGDRLVSVDTGDLPAGNLLFIGGNATAGWTVAQQSGTQITLFHAASLTGAPWKAQRQESVARDFWSGANAFWIWSTPGGIAYATSQGAIRYLDFATGAWADRAAPKNDRLMAVAPNPGGSLGALTSPGGGFGGVFAGTYLSRDEARTWQEIQGPFKVKVTPPMQAADGTLYMAGGVFDSPELQRSADQGATWQRASEFRLDSQLHLLPSGAMLAVDRGQFGLFSLRHSADGGKTWRTEYSNFNRQAYEAEEQRKKK